MDQNQPRDEASGAQPPADPGSSDQSGHSYIAVALSIGQSRSSLLVAAPSGPTLHIPPGDVPQATTPRVMRSTKYANKLTRTQQAAANTIVTAV